jgi:hypothetical protein
VDKETHTLRPGQKAVAKKNVLHSFRNTTEERARFLVELHPGHAGFEKAVKVAYGLASDGRNPFHHPYYMAVLLEWSDMRLPGVFSVAEPLFRLLAKRDRQRVRGQVLAVDQPPSFTRRGVAGHCRPALSPGYVQPLRTPLFTKANKKDRSRATGRASSKPPHTRPLSSPAP